MSIPQSIPLYEVAPLPSDDTISQQFMLDDLARSGLVPEDLSAYAIASTFGIGQYLIPYPVPHMWVRRIDTQVDKYRGPKGQTDLWTSPHQYPASSTLWLIEGAKKSAKFSKHFGIMSWAIRGCRGFSSGNALHPTLFNLVKQHEAVHVVFDGDIQSNMQIQHAANALKVLLDPLKVTLKVFRPPLGKGCDDFIVEDPDAQLSDLVNIPLEELQMGRKQVLALAQVMLNDKGGFETNENNALKLLKVLYKGRVMKDKHLGIIIDGAICGDIDTFKFNALVNLQENISARFAKSVTYNATDGLFIDSEIDLVSEAVKAVKWDGVPRLNTWGSEYIPEDIPAIAADFGRRLMTALALRITQPGVKVDFAFLVLGAQGTFKTTFLEDLGTFEGYKLYYPLTVVPTAQTGQSTRHHMVMCAKSVVVDLSEGIMLDSRGATPENIKQFISQTEDSIQVLYKRDPEVLKRSYIICSASNRTDITTDKSGSRRFVAVNVKSRHIKRLSYVVKMQLLAEALATYNPETWFEDSVRMEDIPEEHRALYPHIKSVRELINIDYAKHDAPTDFIHQLIASGDAATLKDGTGALFLTAKYVADRMNESSREVTSVTLIAKILRQLSESPTFPYILMRSRKRATQLTMNDWQKQSYFSGITNNLSDLGGYVVSTS